MAGFADPPRTHQQTELMVTGILELAFRAEEKPIEPSLCKGVPSYGRAGEQNY